MITDFLIHHLLLPLLHVALAPLPTGSLPSVDASGWLGFLAPLNYMLPIGEVFAAVGVVLALGPAFCTVTLGLWLLGIIRGGGNRA